MDKGEMEKQLLTTQQILYQAGNGNGHLEENNGVAESFTE
jgi:hypothetical protein